MIYFFLHYFTRGYGFRTSFNLAQNRQYEARSLRRKGDSK